MLDKIYEHIVRLNSGEEGITREQLWKGLVYFTEHPDKLMPHIEEVSVEKQMRTPGDFVFLRTLNFGSFEVEDRVEFTSHEKIRYEIKASDKFPDSAHEIEINEPSSGDLFLRFTYFEDPEKSLDNIYPQGAELRRQAWQAKDQGLARLIMEAAAQGQLDTLN